MPHVTPEKFRSHAVKNMQIYIAGKCVTTRCPLCVGEISVNAKAKTPKAMADLGICLNYHLLKNHKIHSNAGTADSAGTPNVVRAVKAIAQAQGWRAGPVGPSVRWGKKVKAQFYWLVSPFFWTPDDAIDAVLASADFFTLLQRAGHTVYKTTHGREQVACLWYHAELHEFWKTQLARHTIDYGQLHADMLATTSLPLEAEISE